MKRLLDKIFMDHLKLGNYYVIASDVGYFPESRKHKNFIDVGNNESCVGSIAEALLSQGKNVFIYDICGYILKNSYASLYARNNTYHYGKGILTVFGWGSGFSYDGCMLGHYPTDDVMLAKLLGLKVVSPYSLEQVKGMNFYKQDLYIRLFDIDEYEYTGYKELSGATLLVSHGWILGLLQKRANGVFRGKKSVVVPYYDTLHTDMEMYYFTDQVYSPVSHRFSTVFSPKNPNTNPEASKIYIDKESCIREWFELY